LKVIIHWGVAGGRGSVRPSLASESKG